MWKQKNAKTYKNGGGVGVGEILNQRLHQRSKMSALRHGKKSINAGSLDGRLQEHAAWASYMWSVNTRKWSVDKCSEV